MTTSIICDYPEEEYESHPATLKVIGYVREGPTAATWDSQAIKDSCLNHVGDATEDVVELTKAADPVENGWYVRIELNGVKDAR